MADLTDQQAVNGSEPDLLDFLGGLREQRVAETQTSLPLPDTQERLWATVKMTEGSTRVLTALQAGADGAIGMACEFIAKATVALILADGGDGEALQRQPVGPRPFPGGQDGMPVTFASPLEALAPQLCPPRPLGGEHTPASRARALIASDPLVEGFAMRLAAWMQGAGRSVSEQFVGESRGGPR